MAAFAVAVVAGLAGGNETSSILMRSLMAMVLCYPLGLIVGLICERVVDEQARAHQARHPMPGMPVDGAGPAMPAADGRGTARPGGPAPHPLGVHGTEDVLVV